jgi:hypothetical protein
MVNGSLMPVFSNDKRAATLRSDGAIGGDWPAFVW